MYGTTAEQALTAARTINPQIERIFRQMRRLHEELNETLYTTPSEERPTIHSPQDIAAIMTPLLASLDHEELWVVLLDTRNNVQSLIKLYQGSLNTQQVRVAEVFKQAILQTASNLIVVHNHPSGDPAPSLEDIAVTHAIVAMGNELDIKCLDHLVIARTGYRSLKERGLGFD